MCQVPALGSWSEYRRSLYSLDVRTCLTLGMWSMPLRKGQLLESLVLERGKHSGLIRITGYSNCLLKAAIEREGLHRVKSFLASHGMEAREQLQSVLVGGAHY